MAISTLSGYAAEHYARRCIDTVTGLVPVSSCAFYRVDAQLRPRDYLLHQMAGQVHQVYLSQYQHLDPLHPARFGSGRHAVVPMAEALPRPVLTRSRYGAFMSRHGMADVVELFVRSRGRVVAGFSLIRTEELGAFSAGEVQMLEHLHGLLELAAEGSLPPLDTPGVPSAATRLTPREREIALMVRDGACKGIGNPTA